MYDAASGFERISNLLRDPNLDKVAALIGNLDRKQPAAIHRTQAAADEGKEGAYGIH
jgi:hypothetical protein